MFEKKTVSLSDGPPFGYPGPLFNPYAVKSVVANADFGEGYYDYDVVDAKDYEGLLRSYEALIAIALRAKAI